MALDLSALRTKLKVNPFKTGGFKFPETKMQEPVITSKLDLTALTTPAVEPVATKVGFSEFAQEFLPTARKGRDIFKELMLPREDEIAKDPDTGIELTRFGETVIRDDSGKIVGAVDMLPLTTLGAKSRRLATGLLRKIIKKGNNADIKTAKKIVGKLTGDTTEIETKRMQSNLLKLSKGKPIKLAPRPTVDTTALKPTVKKPTTLGNKAKARGDSFEEYIEGQKIINKIPEELEPIRQVMNKFNTEKEWFDFAKTIRSTTDEKLKKSFNLFMDRNPFLGTLSGRAKTTKIGKFRLENKIKGVIDLFKLKTQSKSEFKQLWDKGGMGDSIKVARAKEVEKEAIRFWDNGFWKIKKDAKVITISLSDISKITQRQKGVTEKGVQKWMQKIKSGERPTILVGMRENLQKGVIGKRPLEPTILDGHHTLEAYKRLGIKEIPILDNTQSKSEFKQLWDKGRKPLEEIFDVPAISRKTKTTLPKVLKEKLPADTHIQGIVKPEISKSVSSFNDSIKTSYDEIFSLPPETKGQAFRRIVEDFNIRLKILNNEIKKIAGVDKIRENLDLYARKDMLPRRTSDAIERVRKQRTDFVQKLVDNDVKLEKLDEYLHARHAVERNAKMKKVSGKDIDGLSGMTDKKAKEILKDIPDNYKKFTKDVDKLIDDNLEYQIKEGLIKKSEADIIRNTYDNYIPLYRDVDNSFTGIGLGSDIRGKEIKRAKGSERKVTSPIGNVFYQIEKARVRVLKNEVGQTIDNLVKEYSELKDFFKIEKQQYIPRYDASGELQYLDPKFKLADNILGFKKDGTQYFIEIADIKTAKALRNTDLARLPKFMQPLRAGIAIWSGFKTRWNPEFLITNFQRDLGEALINLNVEKAILKKEGKNLRREVVKDLFPSQNEIRKHLRGKKHSEQFDEFLKYGGDTGHFWVETAKKGEENILKLEKRLKGEGIQRPLNYGREAMQFIDDVNSVVELGVRFSAYKNLVKRGMSKNEASQAVADLTVNFSRQGEIAPFLKAFYGFINPALQGTSKVFRTISSKQGRRRVAQAITGLVALGYFNRILSMAIDPEGDEAIPNYSKNHKLVFALGEGRTATLWQMPYGFTTFFALGSNIAEIQMNKKTWGEGAEQVAKTGVNSFSPFDTDLYSLLPTLAKPLFEVNANKAWYDGPIYPEQKFTRTPKPDSETHFKNTSETSKFIAKLLNILSGGDEDTAGAIDMHPDSLKYLFNQYTGGPVTFTQQTLEAMGRGVSGEFNPNETPFVKKFYRQDEPKGFVYGTINDTLERAYKKDLGLLEINRFYRAVDVGLNKKIIDQEYADRVIKDFIKARYKITGTITSDENKIKIQKMKEVDSARLINTYAEGTQKKLNKLLKQDKKSLDNIFQTHRKSLEEIFKLK